MNETDYLKNKINSKMYHAKVSNFRLLYVIFGEDLDKMKCR